MLPSDRVYESGRVYGSRARSAAHNTCVLASRLATRAATQIYQSWSRAAVTALIDNSNEEVGSLTLDHQPAVNSIGDFSQHIYKVVDFLTFQRA